MSTPGPEVLGQEMLPVIKGELSRPEERFAWSNFLSTYQRLNDSIARLPTTPDQNGKDPRKELFDRFQAEFKYIGLETETLPSVFHTAASTEYKKKLLITSSVDLHRLVQAGRDQAGEPTLLFGDASDQAKFEPGKQYQNQTVTAFVPNNKYMLVITNLMRVGTTDVSPVSSELQTEGEAQMSNPTFQESAFIQVINLADVHKDPPLAPMRSPGFELILRQSDLPNPETGMIESKTTFDVGTSPGVLSKLRFFHKDQ